MIEMEMDMQMKLIGGINKDRPNEEDIKAAVDFYKGIIDGTV